MLVAKLFQPSEITEMTNRKENENKRNDARRQRFEV